MQATIVVVRSSGQARLCDFVLSSLLGDSSTYTEDTSILGTIRFLSPELLTGELEARNKWSDIWALGCASGEVGFLTSDEARTYQHIFKILCDERPYGWITNDWLLPGAITKGPPYIWPNPDGFVKCIASCFEIDPVRRPTSSELIE